MQRNQNKQPKQMPPLPPELRKARLISIFSLARKAGKLVGGAYMVKEAVLTGRVGVVFTCRDLAPRSRKEMRFVCSPGQGTPEGAQGAQVIEIDVAMDELAVQIGRRSGILAVTDQGLEKNLTALALAAVTPETAAETDMRSGRESC